MKQNEICIKIVSVDTSPAPGTKFNQNLSLLEVKHGWIDEWSYIPNHHYVFIHWSRIKLIMNCFSRLKNSQHWEHILKKGTTYVRLNYERIMNDWLNVQGFWSLVGTATFLLPTHQYQLRCPHSYQWVLGPISFGIKQPKQEADHSVSSNSEV